MRQILAILLLVSVSYQFVAKMGVIVWYEANQAYVAQELCENKTQPQLHCNGKCYLKKQLNKVENTGSENQLPAKKVKSELPEYMAATSMFTIGSIFSSPIPQYGQYINIYHFHSVRSIFHPPPVC